MSLPAEKLATEPTPGEFMSLADAAARMGGMDHGHLRRKCAEEYGPRGLAEKNEAGGWMVSKAADPRLRDFETREGRDDRQINELRRQKFPEKLLKRRIRLRDLLVEFEMSGGQGTEPKRVHRFLSVKSGNGELRAKGIKHYKPASFIKHLNKYRDGGIAALPPRGYSRRKASFGPAAIEHFLRIMRTGIIEVAEAHRLTQGYIAENKLQNVEEWSLPALRTVQLYWQQEIPHAGKVLLRDGPRKMQANCIPKITRNPLEDYAAGELLVLDERAFDFMVWEFGDRGWYSYRPKLTALRCGVSGMIVGWYFGPRANSDTILAALKQACLFTQTVPVRMIFDNGPSEKAVARRARKKGDWGHIDEQRIRTATDELGIQVTFAGAFQPWAKSIEGTFAALKVFDKYQIAYVGGSPTEKPWDATRWTKENILTLPTVDEAREQFAAFLDAYHEEPRRSAITQGMSPRQAFKHFYTATPRRATRETLDLLCRKLTEPRPVGRDGVRIDGLWYGKWDEQVFRLQGKKVRVAVDPIERDSVILCQDDGTPICIANVDRAIGFKSEEVRDCIQHQRRCKRIVDRYASSRDYLLKTPVQKIIERRKLAAKANQIPDAHLPPTPEQVSVELVRPELAPAIERVKRAAGAEALRKLSGANAAAEALNRPKRITLADLAAATPTEPETPTYKRTSLYELNKITETTHAPR